MNKKNSPLKKVVQSKLKEIGKTQKDLAGELGTSESALSHLLSRGATDPETMKIITRFLNFDLSFLNTDSQINSKGSTLQQVEKECIEQLEHLKELLKAKDELIRSKDETIAALRQSIRN